jgi:hypothetical protein
MMIVVNHFPTKGEQKMSPVGTPTAPFGSAVAPSDTPVDEAPVSTEADAKTDETEKPKQKAQPRDYNVMTKISGTPDKVKAELDKLGDAKITVYVLQGTANALQPKLALGNYAKSIDGDLDGKYTLAAANSFKEFSVKSEPVTKHQVKIS